MRSSRTWLLWCACAGLLSVQLSGVHVHLDGHGYSGAPTGRHHHSEEMDAGERAHGHAVGHDHDHGGADTDHDGDVDVAIAQLAAGVWKLIFFLCWTAVGLIVLCQPRARPRVATTKPRPRPRYEMWRPPLRAPPSLSPQLNR